MSFSERAVAKLTGRKSKVPNWYLDLSMIINYWEGSRRAYHHTAPINMIYALDRALELIFAEGTDAVFARHRDSHLKLMSGLEELGFSPFVAPPHRLPMLNTVRCPEGVDEAKVRERLLGDYRIEIGGGLGPLAGKIWRIGLMGHTARKSNVDRFLECLRAILAA